MATTNITMRMDEELKIQLQELVANLGMDMTTFFTLSAKQAVREQRIPFDISMRTPNSETIEAINEIEEYKKNPNAYKKYSSFAELLDEVRTDA